METKYFVWFDSGDRTITYGPHYVGQVALIGKKNYHTLDDLLKLDISETMKKRLSRAKVGSEVVFHDLHANGELCLKRVSEEDKSLLDEAAQIIDTVIEHRKSENLLMEAYNKIQKKVIKKRN